MTGKAEMAESRPRGSHHKLDLYNRERYAAPVPRIILHNDTLAYLYITTMSSPTKQETPKPAHVAVMPIAAW